MSGLDNAWSDTEAPIELLSDHQLWILGVYIDEARKSVIIRLRTACLLPIRWAGTGVNLDRDVCQSGVPQRDRAVYQSNQSNPTDNCYLSQTMKQPRQTERACCG